MRAAYPLDRLTRRRFDELVASIEENTVEVHVSAILRKAQVDSRASLIASLRRGGDHRVGVEARELAPARRTEWRRLGAGRAGRRHLSAAFP